MNTPQPQADSRQARWARFRFSIIGPLLSAPPSKGKLQSVLRELAQTHWQHPITGLPIQFSPATIERWFYKARQANDPIGKLNNKPRTDCAKPRRVTAAIKTVMVNQHKAHPSWSYQLHWDNLNALIKQQPELGEMPSYHTLRRYMKANGLCKQARVCAASTPGAQRAKARLEQREIRSFEMEYVHSLWHLDFHHGSRKVLNKKGQWQKPLLLAILDDHSRLICHAQWYWDETVESLVHGFKQALQKRGVPRGLMSDNGAAMTSAEFTQGLERLSIVHQTTLPYSPYQNAKQEVFWAQVEGRLMAMLEGEPELTLPLMNEALIAWIEFEYHRTFHSEIVSTPLDRYTNSKSVGRVCPSTETLTQGFCSQVKRRQRKSDGTFTLNGCRFEVPSQYRHRDELVVRFARWDLSRA